MEKETINIAEMQELEAKYRKMFSETLNPCYLAIAASYKNIIEAKKENIKIAEQEDNIGL